MVLLRPARGLSADDTADDLPRAQALRGPLIGAGAQRAPRRGVEMAGCRRGPGTGAAVCTSPACLDARAFSKDHNAGGQNKTTCSFISLCGFQTISLLHEGCPASVQPRNVKRALAAGASARQPSCLRVGSPRGWAAGAA